MADTTLEDFLSKQKETVHSNPTNDYQRFMNAYVLVNSNDRRHDSIRKGQDVWRKSSREEIEEVYRKAASKLSKTTSIRSFFKPIAKVREDRQMPRGGWLRNVICLFSRKLRLQTLRPALRLRQRLHLMNPQMHWLTCSQHQRQLQQQD